MEQNNQNHGNMCGTCGSCGQCHHGHHMKIHILRWVLGIVIIYMIFSLGIKVGEFKSMLSEGRGYPTRMMSRDYPNMMYGAYGQVEAVPAGVPAGQTVTTGMMKVVR